MDWSVDCEHVSALRKVPSLEPSAGDHLFSVSMDACHHLSPSPPELPLKALLFALPEYDLWNFDTSPTYRNTSLV